jgi:hypothetical protein
MAATGFMHTYSGNEDFAAQQRARTACAACARSSLGSWQVERSASSGAFEEAPDMRDAPRPRHRFFVTGAQKNRGMNTYA